MGAKLPSSGAQIYLNPEIIERYKSQHTKKSWLRTGVSGGVGKWAHKSSMHEVSTHKYKTCHSDLQFKFKNTPRRSHEYG